MRILSIQQPWASLIAMDIKDIENRTWPPKYSGKILIHASTTKTPKKFPDGQTLEVQSFINNELIFGNLTNMREEFPTTAIVGYVTVDGDTNESNSIWACPCDHQWILKDAWLFDEPIRDVKGKLSLWNYPDIDESNLPKAHKWERKYVPSFEGDKLIIPVTEEKFDEIITQGCLRLDITDETEALCYGKDSNYREFKTLVLKAPSRTEKFKIIGASFGSWIDKETEEEIYVPNWFGDLVPYQFYQFDIEKIKE
ncbi:MAG: ASCH domain-containing protein [Bacteroidales bacterium]|nr:ASCH domain-containing protein [Bacteroidales bacterium]